MVISTIARIDVIVHIVLTDWATIQMFKQPEHQTTKQLKHQTTKTLNNQSSG